MRVRTARTRSQAAAAVARWQPRLACRRSWRRDQSTGWTLHRVTCSYFRRSIACERDPYATDIAAVTAAFRGWPQRFEDDGCGGTSHLPVAPVPENPRAVRNIELVRPYADAPVPRQGSRSRPGLRGRSAQNFVTGDRGWERGSASTSRGTSSRVRRWPATRSRSCTRRCDQSKASRDDVRGPSHDRFQFRCDETRASGRGRGNRRHACRSSADARDRDAHGRAAGWAGPGPLVVVLRKRAGDRRRARARARHCSMPCASSFISRVPRKAAALASAAPARC